VFYFVINELEIVLIVVSLRLPKKLKPIWILGGSSYLFLSLSLSLLLL